MKRVYPDAEVIVDKEPRHTSCKRFLNEIKGDYVHVTDADIFILPHEKTHKEYYTQFQVKGACYLRGATIGGGKEWVGDSARICGGVVGLTPEYYSRTAAARLKYASCLEDYREFDEVMLARILRDSGYPIPENPYTFPDNSEWDWEYRDLHLNDFTSMKYLKWLPSKEKIKSLFMDEVFKELVADLSPFWSHPFNIIQEYIS